MRDNNRTFITYYYDQEVVTTGAYAGSGIIMPREVKTDIEALAYARDRMKQFPNLRVFNIERQTTNYQHITEWEKE